MRRWNPYWLIAAFFLSLSPQAFAQITPGPIYPNGSAGLSFVAALPATCTPGVTASVQLSVSPYTIYYCSATNTWTAVGGGTGVTSFNTRTGAVVPVSGDYGNAVAGVFVISTSCSVVFPSCLQWVDDDSTDNCLNAGNTAFFAAVNAYAGPGRVQLLIGGSGPGKAYKLATTNCNIPITGTSANGAVVHLFATIDCAQTADNCFQFGPTGQVSEQASENYDLVGNGHIFGGANLTTAGIHMEPGINGFLIDGIQFNGPTGATHNGGFGANNATLGNCTNYLIYIDNPIAFGKVINTNGGVSSTSSTSGGCGYANLNGSATGSNTITFLNNTLGTPGDVSPGTVCGSQAYIDGGSYGMMQNNIAYGFSVPIRVQGLGHRIIGNTIDSTGCSASSVNAAIQWGASGSSTTIQSVDVSDNVIQGLAGHTTYLIARAGNSTAGVQDWVVNRNVNSTATVTNNSNLLMPTGATSTCTVNTLTGLPCVASGNRGFYQNIYGALTNWVSAPDLLPYFFTGGVSANVAPATAFTVPTSTPFNALITVTCLPEIGVIGTTSTLPTCSVKFTDVNSSAVQTVTLTASSSSNTLGSYPAGSATIYPKAGSTIQICTGNTSCDAGGTNYASTGTAMVYSATVTLRMAP